MPTSTPWGPAQDTTKIARGLVFYSTARHGGYHVSKTMQEQMPDALRLNSGWYEEDCDYALVVAAFPQHFPNDDPKTIKQSIRDWHPDRFEAFYKEPIFEGQSIMRDKKLFWERNKENLVIRAAWGLGEVNAVLVVASRGGETTFDNPGYDKQYFFVATKEYDTREKYFVVDPERHMLFPEEHWVNYIEHPDAVVRYYEKHGITKLYAEEKYTGSRGHSLVFKNLETAQKMGFTHAAIVNSRSGFTFFDDPNSSPRKPLTLVTGIAAKSLGHDTVIVFGQEGYLAGFTSASACRVIDARGRFIKKPGKSYTNINLSEVRRVHKNQGMVSFLKAA